MEGWTCVYCGHPNPYNARFCVNCNARIPDLRQKFIQEQDKEEPVSVSKNAEFKAPKPGDIVGGLFELSDKALSGEISPAEFGDTIMFMSENIQAAFDTIFSELEQIPEDVGDYASNVREIVEEVQFMLTKGLEEMYLFSQDQDPSHIRFGRMIAQRAELDYIGVMEMVNADAHANPFEGESNVLGRMASLVMRGEMDSNTFCENVSTLENTVLGYIDKSKKILKDAFKKAKEFDGSNEEVLTKAIDQTKEATEVLSKAILNLYDPEEVRSALESTIANVLDEMEEEEED